MTGVARTVAEALALRRWAASVLASGPAPAPDCAADGWRLFLGAERCAARLSLALGDEAGRLPGPGGDLFRRRRTLEAQRTLVLRAQLGELAGIAREGFTIVVLRGGVTAADARTAVDLHDIDVLVPSESAAAVAARLDALGYRAEGPGTRQHLQTRFAEGRLPIEIHVSVELDGTAPSGELWRRVIPLTGFEGLRRLGPRHHLLELLQHVGVKHSFRMGAIRDTLLIGSALSECSTQDVEAVEARCRDHEFGADMLELLALSKSEGRAESQALERRRAAALATAALVAGLPLSPVGRSDVSQWVLAMQLEPRYRRTLWRELFPARRDVSYAKPIAALERRWPRVGRGARVAARLARYVFSILLALPLAARSRWMVNRLPDVAA